MTKVVPDYKDTWKLEECTLDEVLNIINDINYINSLPPITEIEKKENNNG